MKASALVIKTPEGIVFSQTLAGPVTRFFAWFIDLMSIGIIVSALGTVLGELRVISVDVTAAGLTLGYFAISIGYGIFLEWAWRGHTIGTRLVGLPGGDARGLRVQPGR